MQMRTIVKTSMLAAALLLSSQVSAAAFNISPNNLPNQATFNALADDLSAGIWMNPGNSAEAHSAGLIPVGVQAALELSSLDINANDAHWQLMGVTSSVLPLPSLRISAGLPFGLDFGYMLTSIPSSNIEVSGLEVRMALGSFIPVPMLEANVRYHQSDLTGVSDFEVSNVGFAAMVGANLPIAKPYIEFGTVTSITTPSGALAALFSKYEKRQTTMAIGAKVELALMVLNLELATIGDKKLTTIKVGFEF